MIPQWAKDTANKVADPIVKNPKMTATGAAVAAAPLLALPLIGFGATGVAAGSLAAGWQATIGNVAGGSIFALLQSAGATLGAATVVQTAAAGGIFGAGIGVATNKKVCVQEEFIDGDDKVVDVVKS